MGVLAGIVTADTWRMGNLRHLWQNAFLVALAESGVMSHAAEAAGIDRVTVFRARKSDPEFDTACQDAIEEATDKLVQEARRRALEGVEEPVYQGGVLVGTKRVYSDALMSKLLAAYRPQQFGTQRTELTGANGGPVQQQSTIIIATGVPADDAEGLV